MDVPVLSVNAVVGALPGAVALPEGGSVRTMVLQSNVVDWPVANYATVSQIASTSVGITLFSRMVGMQ